MKNIWQNQILERQKKKNKYNAKPMDYDGHRFHSTFECTVYIHLKKAMLGKLIYNLELQPKFPVFINNKLYCTYTADFRFTNTKGKVRILDAKGFDDAASKLRRKAAHLCHGINIEIIKKLGDLEI